MCTKQAKVQRQKEEEERESGLPGVGPSLHFNDTNKSHVSILLIYATTNFFKKYGARSRQDGPT